MKICPNCRRTYEDDGLNFCLEDGSVLTFASAEPPPTVVMETPRPTAPSPAWQPQTAPAYSKQPKKKSSKAWIWLLAIFSLLILVCGGGFVGFFMYVASIANSNVTANKGARNSTLPTPAKANTNTATSSQTPRPSTEWTGEAKEIDLSSWVEDPTVWLETQFENGEFFMTSKQKGYYYVLVSKDDDFSGGNVSRVTVRNSDEKDVSMGYGLVFHSDMTPLAKGYAFLIDSNRKKYRVVRHENEQEKVVTAWTSSNLIKAGREDNVLEARDKGDRVELYINGELAGSITNKQGPTGGVPGLYVGDGSKIGFRKLEVVK